MEGDNTACHIVEVSIGKTSVIHHALQRLLIWVHANGLC